MTYVEPPTGDCPKCGTPNAWKGTRPMYAKPVPPPTERGDEASAPDHLDWDCNWCGYTMTTPPADATAFIRSHEHRFVGVPGALIGNAIRDIEVCQCGLVLADGLVLS